VLQAKLRGFVQYFGKNGCPLFALSGKTKAFEQTLNTKIFWAKLRHIVLHCTLDKLTKFIHSVLSGKIEGHCILWKKTDAR
jgi:hypothetical protein